MVPVLGNGTIILPKIETQESSEIILSIFILT